MGWEVDAFETVGLTPGERPRRERTRLRTRAAAAPPRAGAPSVSPRCRPAGAGGATRAAELPDKGINPPVREGGNYEAVKKSRRWMFMNDYYYFCCCFNGKPELESRNQRSPEALGISRLWLHPKPNSLSSKPTLSFLQTLLTLPPKVSSAGDPQGARGGLGLAPAPLSCRKLRFPGVSSGAA